LLKLDRSANAWDKTVDIIPRLILIGTRKYTANREFVGDIIPESAALDGK
jgi:hypothetical protein